MTSTRAADLVQKLALQPHPEGGWYREIYRSPTRVETARGLRSALTTIYYLLEQNQLSRWHVVQADELWHFYAGSPLELLAYTPGTRKFERSVLDCVGAAEPVGSVHGVSAATAAGRAAVAAGAGEAAGAGRAAVAAGTGEAAGAGRAVVAAGTGEAAGAGRAVVAAGTGEAAGAGRAVVAAGAGEGGATSVSVIPTGVWQAARSLGEYSLVGCTVGPGFEFADFQFVSTLAAHADHFKGDLAAFANLL